MRLRSSKGIQESVFIGPLQLNFRRDQPLEDKQANFASGMIV